MKKLIFSTSLYKTYDELNEKGEITTIYDLINIKQAGQSEIFSQRAKFLWKYKHLFAINDIHFDKKITNIDSIRKSNIGNYLKTLTIKEAGKKTLSEYIGDFNTLNYDEIRGNIGKLCETLRILHALSFAYGSLSTETIFTDFSLRMPPLVFLKNSLPNITQQRFSNDISFSKRSNSMRNDVRSLGFVLYSLVFDSKVESEITQVPKESFPQLISNMVYSNENNFSVIDDAIIKRIKAFIKHRYRIINSD